MIWRLVNSALRSLTQSSQTATATRPRRAKLQQATVMLEHLEERMVLSGIWISGDELLNLPTSGPAWETVASAAAIITPAPNIQDQDERTDVLTLSKALVGARLNNSDYIAQVRTNVMAAIGSELGGRTLALGRNLASYVIAADIVGLEPAQEARFEAWLQQALTEELDGKTLQSTHEIRPNNWGTMAGASRAAIAAYLGDQAELARTGQVFKGWLGDLSSYAGFEFGTDLSWQADPNRPVAVNPKGAIKEGHSIDGALPDDMRRGGPFMFPPAPTGYPWEAMQGVIVQAEILSRAGYDAWNWQDQAVLRAVQFLYGIGWQALGDDAWMPWVIDAHYGTHLASNPRAEPGKVMGWTAWTHQLGAATTGNLAPVVHAGVDQTVLLPASAALDGTVTDDGMPRIPGAVTTRWSNASGPGTVTFGDPAAVDTTASFSAPGTYVLRLQASDGAVISGDRVTITVVDPIQNDPPVVGAGADQTILIGGSVNLDGTVTDDGRPNPPGAVATVWSKVRGPGRVTFGDAFAVDTPATFSAPGTYLLKLAASDSSLGGKDTVTIKVVGANQAPVVDAGPDKSTQRLDLVRLNGTIKDDGLPDQPGTVTVEWSKVSGPGDVFIANPAVADTTATFGQPGVYELRLKASDGVLASEDTVTLTVGAATNNDAPVVNAGADVTVRAYYRDEGVDQDEGDGRNPDSPRRAPKKPKTNQGGNSGLGKRKIFVGAAVVLDGTVTDDGQPNPPGGVRTRWSKLSGQGNVNFADPSAVDTVARFNRPGTYVLRLTANDGILANSDEIVITVLSPNLAPIVMVGPDQDVVLGTPVTLRGAVTDDGLPNPPGQFGTVWSVVNGPGTVTFGNSSGVETTAQFSKAGMYRLRLTANDGERVGWQDVKIKVKKPAVIKPPKVRGPKLDD